MRSELTADEADVVMANVHPQNRRWCTASCGPIPGEPIIDWGCACTGCIGGNLSWDEWMAWQEREKNRAQTPYVELDAAPRQLSLAERLEDFKARKRSAPQLEVKP